jgi:hypothetical protein
VFEWLNEKDKALSRFDEWHKSNNPTGRPSKTSDAYKPKCPGEYLLTLISHDTETTMATVIRQEMIGTQ